MSSVVGPIRKLTDHELEIMKKSFEDGIKIGMRQAASIAKDHGGGESAYNAIEKAAFAND